VIGETKTTYRLKDLATGKRISANGMEAFRFAPRKIWFEEVPEPAPPVLAPPVLAAPASASPASASPAPRFVRLKNQSTTDHKASPSALSIINENTT